MALEWLTLLLFCAALLCCIALDISILYALFLGLLLFLFYGRRRGFAWRELGRMALEGVRTIQTILLTFLLIGILTALWRASGTIPAIVAYASSLIRPGVFLLTAFLLNCGVSILTGTSFGTSATIGVICVTIGAAMRMDLRLVGGAVLSGAFFGDRCSPVSTSALLVSALTETDIFDNIRRMLRTALVPFLLTCAVYAALGLLRPSAGEVMDLRALFGREFRLHWLCLAPAAVILLLSLLRAKVRLTLCVSILIAVPLCLFLQRVPPWELARAAFAGYRAADAQVGAMLNGGGIVSMLRVTGIVCLSASYSGLFRQTGLLDGARRGIQALSHKTTPYAATLLTALLSGMVACNQTLTIMLTRQLCEGDYTDGSDLALDLEDSAVIASPLIPWSIAGGAPLASAGAPLGALLFACYLYLLPLWRLTASAVLGIAHKNRA